MSRSHGSSQLSSRRMDMVHIILGIVITVMAVLAFLHPDENMVLFPLIFFSAALLKLISAIRTLRTSLQEHRRSWGSIAQLTLGIVLLGIGVLSAVSIWY